MRTRLEQVIEHFNWQGGTVHQANRVLTKVYRWGEYDKPIDLITMSDLHFRQLMTRIRLTDWSRPDLRRVLNETY